MIGMTHSKIAVVGYLTSGFSSLLGNSAAGILLPIVALTTTGSMLGAAAVAVAQAIPQVVVGLISGSVVDRFNRVKVAAWSDVASAISVFAIAVAMLVNRLDLTTFILLAIIGAVGDIPGHSARDALMKPVSKTLNSDKNRSLEKIAGIEATTSSAALVLGPATAAILISILEQKNALLAVAAISMFAALLTRLMPITLGNISEPSNQGNSSSLLSKAVSDLKLGLSVLRLRPTIVSLWWVTVFGSMAVASLQSVYLPKIFTQNDRPELLGASGSAISIGMMVGAALITTLGARLQNRLKIIATSLLILMATAMQVQEYSLTAIVLGSFLIGFGDVQRATVFQIITMQTIDNSQRGRTLSILNAGTYLMNPFAILAVGALGSTISIGAAGIFILTLSVMGVILTLSLPSLSAKKLNRIEPKDE